MYKRIFLDANVILDKFDSNRPWHRYSSELYNYVVVNSKVYTSCDLITTIYYINSKIDKNSALINIQKITKTLKVIEFSNKEIEDTCELMLRDFDYKDLEDTIQYIMAQKYECDLIISNDTNFVSKDIKIMTSKEFCQEFGISI
jgi:predicted nucleic acid-binding protein